jgi:multidrug efflux system outer membrane protein
VSEVASQYFLLRDLDNRLAIARQTVAYRKESTNIISQRYQKGYVSQIDELLAIQQEAIASAVVPALERQIVQVENALRLLMGKGPGSVSRGLSNFNQNLTPDIPVGLSSQLLERRPDIRTAEKYLNAQFETINVAQANRLPSLSLTGVLGFASPALSTFIGSKGFVANGFGEVFGPIFNFKRNKNLVEVERQKTQQAMYQYRQTVLNAFVDVDNALANYRGYMQEYNEKKRQVDAAEQSLKLYRAKYDNGYSSYLEVTVQETNLLDAQLQLSVVQQGKLNSIVQLYKALGGGWQ